MRTLPTILKKVILNCVFPSLLAANAHAELVEFERVGPFALATGIWSAHLMVRDEPMDCPEGSDTDCHFTFVDIRNSSDQTLSCDTRIEYENGSALGASQGGARRVDLHSAAPTVVLNMGAKISPRPVWEISCTASAPPSSGNTAGGNTGTGRPSTGTGADTGAGNTGTDTGSVNTGTGSGSTNSGTGTVNSGNGNAGSSTAAESVGLEGNIQVSVTNGTATISVDRISNSTRRRVGPLFLVLWATSNNDPFSRGFVLGSSQLGPLDSLVRFTNVQRRFDITNPPDGRYFLHVLLTDAAGVSGQTFDTATMPQASTFAQSTASNANSGAPGNTDSSGTPSTAGGQLGLSGNSAFSIKDKNATIQIGRIANTSSTRTTGRLFLTLRATRGVSTSSEGINIARIELAPLAPLSQYKDINQVVPATLPPAGTYFMHLFISEAPNENTIIDALSFSGTQTFDEPVLGSIDGVWVAILAILLGGLRVWSTKANPSGRTKSMSP